MTDNEIRIAIASESIIEIHPPSDGYRHWWGVRKSDRVRVGIPDYPHDLNAMHEAEKIIHNQAKDYCEWIDKIVGHHNELYNLVFSTARQRAEAFLRTIGKWVETKP